MAHREAGWGVAVVVVPKVKWPGVTLLRFAIDSNTPWNPCMATVGAPARVAPTGGSAVRKDRPLMDAVQSTARVRRTAGGVSRRDIGIVVAYLVVWVALDAAAAHFEAAPEVSVWYPPSALDVALLLTFGLRFWPVLLVNSFLHVLLVGKAGAFDSTTLLVFNAATTAGYAGAAAILLRVVHIDPGLRSARDIVWFVAVGVIAGSLAVAAMQVLNLTLGGRLPLSELVLNTLRYWAGDATGIAMLAPPLLILARRIRGTLPYQAGLDRTPPPAAAPPAAAASGVSDTPRWLLGAEVVVFGIALWLGYGSQRPATLDFTFFVWIPLIWTALRYGFERAALFVLVANLAIAGLSKAGFGAMAGIALQFGLLTFSIVGLLTGAAVTEMRQSAARLRHRALHDPLTELPNRVLFRERIAGALAAPGPGGGPIAVGLLDLDHFKDVNDSLGHLAGDAVLRAVADRLRADAGEGAEPGSTLTVARFAGDEFGLLLTGAADGAALERRLHRLLRRFDEPFVLAGRPQRILASVGVAVATAERDAARVVQQTPPDAPDDQAARPGQTIGTVKVPSADADGPDRLLRDADLALYDAKRSGRGRVRLFSPAMAEELHRRLDMERALRGAFERGEFRLAFQPQFRCSDLRMTGAEALLRWAHPDRGTLRPGEFLRFADSAGLMAHLGTWVLREACAAAAAWPDPTLAVAVNVAPAQWAGEGELVGAVETAFAATGLAPCRLKLEITEDHLLQGQEQRSGAALAALRGRGVRVAIDDFGTGHSGLSRLRRLPVDEIKLDQSFIAGLGTHRDDEAIVRAVLSLSQALGCEVVAEGVETEHQLAFLREVGCTAVQGYLLGPPVDPAAFAAMLAVPGA